MDDSDPAPKPSPRGRPAKPSSGSLLGKRIEVMWDAEDGGKEYYAGKVRNSPRLSPRCRTRRARETSACRRLVHVCRELTVTVHVPQVTNEDATRVKVAYDDGENKWHPIDGLIYREVTII